MFPLLHFPIPTPAKKRRGGKEIGIRPLSADRDTMQSNILHHIHNQIKSPDLTVHIPLEIGHKISVYVFTQDNLISL